MKLGSSIPCPRFFRLALVIVSFFYLAPSGGRAMVISLTYDSSITGLTNATQVESAINLAAQVLDTLYTNPVTINITAYFSSAVNLGQSQEFGPAGFPYSQLTNALRSARTTLADSNSVASLPAADPANGATWWLPNPEAKVLGGFGVGANAPGNDGSVLFASTVNYALDPANRAVSGDFDLTSVAEHEISEAIGRIYSLNVDGNGFVPYDLFRFTGSGVRTLATNAVNAYFSADNGVTPLAYFYSDITMGDIQDWATRTPADSFDAFLSDGTEGYLSYADLTALDVLGYKLNFHAPKLSGARLTNGVMRLTFTNVTGLNFSILASTNLSTAITNWVNLGTPGETSIGNYQLIDATPNKARFYRAVLN